MPTTLAAPTASLRETAATFKALGDETRLAIIVMLQGGELCVCEIMAALPLSQPAVSHHLKILRQAGLVSDRREGKWIYYDLNPAGIAAAGGWLQEALPPPRGGESAGGRQRRHPLCGDV